MDLGNPARPIRARLLANWCDSTYLCELFNRMTRHGNYEWTFVGLDGESRRLRITADDPDPDVWVVINAPPPGQAVPADPERTVVFQMEPLMWTESMRERWGRWAAPSPLSFLQVRDHRRYANSCDWWVGRTYAELAHGALPTKTRQIAACVSEKYFDPGHRKRVDFLRHLDAEDLDLDIYGYAGHGFRRYRSPTPAHDKSSCLLPYRYYFDAENNASPNFFTEKIVDCLLAETLCFYWGCPNLESYFDPRAFVRLELKDFGEDVARINEAIAADEWTARLPFIRAEKRRILEDYGFFPTLARAIDPARRRRRRSAGAADRSAVDRWIGAGRAGVFVEVSDRTTPPEVSETLDVERRLDWSGICLESDLDRVRAGRSVRDCIVASDLGDPLDSILEHNGISPIAVDWLNLAVASPSNLLAPGGRLDPSKLRANLISLPLAGSDERNRCRKLLELAGYEAAVQDPEGMVLMRRGRDDVFGFFHLFTVNSWREILAEQVGRLLESGLAARTSRIFASVVGPEAADGAAALRDGLEGSVEVVLEPGSPERSERSVLERARFFCEREEPLAKGVWYLHAKGVSSRHLTNPNVTDWRRLMEHFVIDDWRVCLASLEDHDACGVNWHEEPQPHFSGNFWWARPRYVASLPEKIGPLPFEQEAWIGTNQPRIRTLHESGVDHHLEPYPERLYGRR